MNGKKEEWLLMHAHFFHYSREIIKKRTQVPKGLILKYARVIFWKKLCVLIVQKRGSKEGRIVFYVMCVKYAHIISIQPYIQPNI